MTALTITSPNNPRIAEIKRLWQAKYRRQTGRFLVEGFTFVEEAAAEGLAVEVVYAESVRHKDRFDEISAIMEKRRIPSLAVSDRTFRCLSQEETPPGILALVRKPGLSGSLPNLIIALDQIQDPGNMGTILRTAENLGAKLALTGRGCVDIYNPKVVRASAGAVWRLPVREEADLAKELKGLKKNGYRILMTLPAGGQAIDKFDWPAKCVIVLGNEAKGVDKGLLGLADHKVYIPRKGRTESLNVAAAAAIFVHEAARNMTL